MDTDHSLKHLVLTGHKDGNVLIWRLQHFIGVLVQYSCEVTTMSKCFEGIAIGTAHGHIYIWDEYLLACGKKIDLNSMPFKILGSYITAIDYS